MKCEVQTFDYYLTGQCYGYQLFEGEVETDSCWGFLGDIRSVQDELKEYMPKGFEDIVESLHVEYSEFNMDEYLDELKETEDMDYAR